MVYLGHSISGFCKVGGRKKRMLAMGTGIEQRPWTPTVRRGKIAAESASPGPACVQLPSLLGTKVSDSKKKASPAFSFGQRHRGVDDSIGPGPAQYNVTGLGAKGKDNPPASSLQSRPRDKSKFSTPAPGEYDVNKASKMIVDAAPKFTFGLKTQTDKPSQTPAPNIYKIPTVLGTSKEGQIRSAPAYTIRGRHKDAALPAVPMPGPGAYDGEYQAIRRRPPMYSMGVRTKIPTDATLKPGPGAHCPEKVYVVHKTKLTPSFGIRHSNLLGTQKAYLLPRIPPTSSIFPAICHLERTSC